jgi:hypothetical protein
MGEEIDEVTEKPQSMLTPKVRQVLLQTIESETKKALERGDDAYLMDLQNARKLVERGCWSVRRANPYLEHVAECVAEIRPHEGKLTLAETQELLKRCAEEWSRMPPEKRLEYRVKAGELGIYDFL